MTAPSPSLPQRHRVGLTLPFREPRPAPLETPPQGGHEDRGSGEAGWLGASPCSPE